MCATIASVQTADEPTPAPRPPADGPWRCIACEADNDGGRFATQSARSLPGIEYSDYGECAECGSLRLIDDIDSAARFGDVYERQRAAPTVPPPSTATRFVGEIGTRLVGRAATRPDRWFPSQMTWAAQFRGADIGLADPILDVDCGNGANLLHLSRFGFTDLLGIDPFLPEPEIDLGAVRLRRGTLTDTSGRFAAIIFKHSLEQVDDPVDHLVAARDRLRHGGVIVVELPIAGGRAWRRFRDNWADLDAPLNRFIPSPTGMRAIAERAGLRVVRWHGASNAHSYRNSLLIQNGANPTSERPENHLSRRMLDWCEAEAGAERGAEATQAIFVLSRMTGPE